VTTLRKAKRRGHCAKAECAISCALKLRKDPNSRQSIDKHTDSRPTQLHVSATERTIIMLSNNDSKVKSGPMSVYSLFSLTIFFADVTADVFRPSQSDPRTRYKRHKIPSDLTC